MVRFWLITYYCQLHQTKEKMQKRNVVCMMSTIKQLLRYIRCHAGFNITNSILLYPIIIIIIIIRYKATIRKRREQEKGKTQF